MEHFESAVERPAPPLAYTPEEAWQLARIGRASFYKAVKDGAIPSVRIGKTIRIPKAKFDALFGIEVT
jgi:excisionase family DNA binding protein